MKVGISLTSNHPDAKDPRQGARWMIERTAAAHRAGLDSLFVGDQHISPTPYYQNTPMLGRLLALGDRSQRKRQPDTLRPAELWSSPDSSLEEAGFEPSVPRDTTEVLRGAHVVSA
jgi:alkanesulfonate monooxygenase SsuD/methylene tetrahydromethanopterin reductase-like flavin-dependent oxidoreductase (luciferase family)